MNGPTIPLDIQSLLAYLLIVAGLAGAVIPVLPGPLLIWLGAFVWAWGDGFQQLGWPTLIVLAVLAVASWGSDLALSTIFTRRAGASWRAIGGGVLGGILGSVLLSGLPILGTIAGAILGAVLGMYAVEYWLKRDSQAAMAAVRAYMGSVLVATIVELFISLFMILIFVWQALL